MEVELLAHTRDVVSRDLPAETGLHTGWVENGGLFIASNKQRLDEYKRLMSVGRSNCPSGQARKLSVVPQGELPKESSPCPSHLGEDGRGVELPMDHFESAAEGGAAHGAQVNPPHLSV